MPDKPESLVDRSDEKRVLDEKSFQQALTTKFLDYTARLVQDAQQLLDKSQVEVGAKVQQKDLISLLDTLSNSSLLQIASSLDFNAPKVTLFVVTPPNYEVGRGMNCKTIYYVFANFFSQI